MSLSPAPAPRSPRPQYLAPPRSRLLPSGLLPGRDPVPPPPSLPALVAQALPERRSSPGNRRRLPAGCGEAGPTSGKGRAEWARQPEVPPPGRARAPFPAMAELLELPRTRIGAAQVAHFIDRPVCFVGRLEKIHPSGKSLVLSDGEGKPVTVELAEPLQEEVSGILEVVGRVTAKATILCASCVPFRDHNRSFDLQLYSDALKIIHEFPQYYPFGATQQD
ncbi:replication protein A 14 kDa subunit [Notamacropus eugenii]|uniref:replication protein A 14 kDa subunit n=1 Tax=Notamacropus eugenii TaxID=9315 RepID=UPI003B67CD81